MLMKVKQSWTMLCQKLSDCGHLSLVEGESVHK